MDTRPRHGDEPARAADTGRRRIWTTVAAAVAVAVAYALLRACGPTAETPAPATSTATDSPPWSTPTPVDPSASDADATASPQQIEQATSVAHRFADDFAEPGTGQQDWLARMSRSCSAYLSAELAATDWRRLSRARVAALYPQVTGVSVADFVIVYDTGQTSAVRVEKLPEGWKVTTVAPAGRP